MQLTLAGFRAWLKGQAPDVVVGRSVMAHHCPLSTYLQTDPTVRAASVCDTRYELRLVSDPYAPPTRYECPEWASKFVVELDSGGLTYRTVSAREALETLDRLGY